MNTLKKTKKRILCGVCGGIAKFIDPDISPVGIRIMWVILSLFHPVTMIIIYAFLAAILKTEIKIIDESIKTDV